MAAARIGHETRKAKTTRPFAALGLNDSSRVMSFSELNSFSADPRLVHHSVHHHLQKPKALKLSNYLCLAMASGRYCDIHLVTHVCEMVRVLAESMQRQG